MRRLLSILVAALLGLGPGMPVVSAQVLNSGWAAGSSGRADEAHLPACCRRNGKHHCAMDSVEASRGETSLSAPDICPCLPGTLASTAPLFPALLNSGTTAHPHPATTVATRSQFQPACKSVRRNWPKRGPPSLQTA